MPADPRLLAHPAVRVEAERLAREHVGATLSLRDVPVVHGTTPDALMRAETEVQVALLADASRPASRDWMARRIAEAVGLTCVATAPSFTYVEASPGSYSFIGEPEDDGYPIHWFMFAVADGHAFGEPDEEGWFPDGKDWHHVPGISALTDPAEALTLAFLAVVR